MTSKPEYVELLNDIRRQEARAGVYLEAWANKTGNKDLKECLSFVAAREYSHGDIFDRRVKELGFATEEIEDPEFDEKVRVVSSDISDAEKIAWLKESRLRMANPDGRERYLHQLQILTGKVPNSDYQAMQHRGLWSSGRGNHYLFDLNRDWLMQVHPETRGLVSRILEWKRHLVVDLHEMGSLNTYLLDPAGST